MKEDPSQADKIPAQAAKTDPVLCELDGVLDTDPLYQQVCTKLDRLTGVTLPREVLLRMLILKHFSQWSLKELEERVKDSLVLRWFCQVAFH